jgi:hypothetical protein
MFNKPKTQVIIETIIAFIVLLALLTGVTKLFLWFADSIAWRQQKFEETRSIIDKGQSANDVARTNACKSICYNGCAYGTIYLSGCKDRCNRECREDYAGDLGISPDDVQMMNETGKPVLDLVN